VAYLLFKIVVLLLYQNAFATLIEYNCLKGKVIVRKLFLISRSHKNVKEHRHKWNKIHAYF